MESYVQICRGRFERSRSSHTWVMSNGSQSVSHGKYHARDPGLSHSLHWYTNKANRTRNKTLSWGLREPRSLWWVNCLLLVGLSYSALEWVLGCLLRCPTSPILPPARCSPSGWWGWGMWCSLPPARGWRRYTPSTTSPRIPLVGSGLSQYPLAMTQNMVSLLPVSV